MLSSAHSKWPRMANWLIWQTNYGKLAFGETTSYHFFVGMLPLCFKTWEKLNWRSLNSIKNLVFELQPKFYLLRISCRNKENIKKFYWCCNF